MESSLLKNLRWIFEFRNTLLKFGASFNSLSYLRELLQYYRKKGINFTSNLPLSLNLIKFNHGNGSKTGPLQYIQR